MMMFPATTTSLPNFFTPRRLLTLSRPFLTLPCPFLCAMRLSGFFRGFRCLGLLGFRRFPAQVDAGDLDPRQLPAVANRAVVTLPATIFEGDDLLVFALLYYFTGDGRAFDEGVALGLLVAVAMEKHIGKNAFLARLFIEKVDIDDISFRDTVLSAACFDNCVSHTKSR